MGMVLEERERERAAGEGEGSEDGELGGGWNRDSPSRVDQLVV